jgi:RNA polymerase sigma-70 factor (ECF subfamily)
MMTTAPAYRLSAWLDVPLGRLVFPAQRAFEATGTIHAQASDTALIDGTLNGNEQAFRILVERYQPQIVRTVTGMLGQSDDVDDTVQEVFIRFHAALPTFRRQASVKTYLTRIAINRSLDVLRSRKRRFFVPWESETVPDRQSDDPDPERQAIQSDERRQLRAAINSLSSRHRAVVVLRLIDGLSTSETAEVLDVPYGTVLSRLKRALTNLKEELGDSFVALPGSADSESDH